MFYLIMKNLQIIIFYQYMLQVGMAHYRGYVHTVKLRPGFTSSSSESRLTDLLTPLDFSTLFSSTLENCDYLN